MGFSIIAAAAVTNPVGWALIGVGVLGLAAMAIRNDQQSRHDHNVMSNRFNLDHLKEKNVNNEKKLLINVNHNPTFEVPSKVADKFNNKKSSLFQKLTRSSMTTVTISSERDRQNLIKLLEKDNKERDQGQIGKQLQALYNQCQTVRQNDLDKFCSKIADLTGKSVDLVKTTFEKQAGSDQIATWLHGKSRGLIFN